MEIFIRGEVLNQVLGDKGKAYLTILDRDTRTMVDVSTKIGPDGALPANVVNNGVVVNIRLTYVKAFRGARGMYLAADLKVEGAPQAVAKEPKK